jgi:hypothetical protein
LKKIYKVNLLILFIITIFYSCVSEPKEGKYRNYTYDEITKKNGNPIYDVIYIVDNNFDLSFIEPDYTLYFTKEELESGIQVRKMIWENTFNYRKIIWLKIIDGQWIVFDSLEYNSKYIQF